MGGVQRSAFHVGEGIRFNHSQAERSSDWTGYAKLGRADAMGIVPDAPSHAVHGRALRRSPRAGRRTSVEVTRSAESVQSFFLSTVPHHRRWTRSAKVRLDNSQLAHSSVARRRSGRWVWGPVFALPESHAAPRIFVADSPPCMRSFPNSLFFPLRMKISRTTRKK